MIKGTRYIETNPERMAHMQEGASWPSEAEFSYTCFSIDNIPTRFSVYKATDEDKKEVYIIERTTERGKTQRKVAYSESSARQIAYDNAQAEVKRLRQKYISENELEGMVDIE